MMDLPLIWFGLLAALLAGYAVLDGFDLGVGIIQPFLRNERERNLAIKAIGPLWDGNEVWLVTFGGALFAAFPEAYASILSAFYIPVMLLLFSLILRAISVDFRNKVAAPGWKKFWDTGFFFSSLLATVVFGAAAGNLLGGIGLDARGDYVGSVSRLFGVFPLACAALAVATFAVHGAIFFYLRTTGNVQSRVANWTWHAWGGFLVLYVLVSLFTLVEHPHVTARVRELPWAIPIVVLNVLAVANIPRMLFMGRYGWAFVSSCTNIVCLVTLFFLSSFPTLVYSTGPGASLTIRNAASSEGTLWLMLIIALLGLPLIASYTVIIYWTFRHPVEME